ncbi:MAG TPA: hypothetical protein VFJ90_03925 [Candidatus Didemnitutus sp.]|nr:hypothetical protein [Candidatus Didemnitutus sp.]
MNIKELSALKESVERSLGAIGDRPTEPGFNQDVYEQLIRIRELLRQCRPELFNDDVQR